MIVLPPDLPVGSESQPGPSESAPIPSEVPPLPPPEPVPPPSATALSKLPEQRPVWRPTSLGCAAIGLLVAGVLTLVVKRFEGPDLLVPVIFVVLEGLIATGGLLYLRNVFITELSGHLEEEEEEVRHLGSRGATLADALIRSGDQRNRAVEATHGATSTLANLLIVLGMVGTAWYLLDNASLFNVVGAKIDETLPRLLAVAPKAFAATGLALSCAAVISLVSAFEVRSIERRAPGSKLLVEAWEQGQSCRTGPKDDQARLVELLERLPGEMRAAAGEAGQATTSLHQSMKTLHLATGKVAKALESTSASVQEVLEESAKTHRAVFSAAKGAVAVTEQLQRTQEQVSSSTVRSLELMDKALQEFEGRLLARTLDEFPARISEATVRAVDAAVGPAVEAFSSRFDERSRELLVQLGEAGRNSFHRARLEFEQAVMASSEHMKQMADRVASLDAASRSFSIGLADAATRWPESAEALAKLDASMGSFHGNASGARSAFEEALRSLNDTTRLLTERAGTVAADARLAGELAGILGTESLGTHRGGRS